MLKNIYLLNTVRWWNLANTSSRLDDADKPNT